MKKAISGTMKMGAEGIKILCGGRLAGAGRGYIPQNGSAGVAASRQDGLVLRGIVTAIRHFGPERARETALCAAETAGDWIVGFGLAGDERIGRPGDFAWAFDCAREAGLRLTCHAGEWCGPQSVRDAIRDLGVERIGHGVRAIEDPALVAELAERRIVLELCPGSNVALGLYPSLHAHPIGKFVESGVRVTVSTDDPPFFRTSMTREYESLAEAFGWDGALLDQFARTAAEAAFCDETARRNILTKLETSHA
jgi:adenosine deaminase